MVARIIQYIRALYPVFFLSFFLIVFVLGSNAQAAPTPELKDIIVTTSTTDLLLFATVNDCFTEKMITGAQNGISITFIFKISLVKIKNNWFDKTLADMEITHTMTYDSLKQEYTVIQSDHPKKRHITRSLEEAQQLMSELNGIHLLPLNRLEPDAPYQLKLKAVLEKATLPLGMHYVLPFTSLWDFETDWRVLDFRY